MTGQDRALPGQDTALIGQDTALPVQDKSPSLNPCCLCQALPCNLQNTEIAIHPRPVEEVVNVPDARRAGDKAIWPEGQKCGPKYGQNYGLSL